MVTRTSTYRQPPLGSIVRVTFEGKVRISTHHSIGVEGGPDAAWNNLNCIPPTVEIIDPGWNVGDVAELLSPDNRRVQLIFRQQVAGRSPQWYDDRGEVVVTPDPHRVRVIARRSPTDSTES